MKKVKLLFTLFMGALMLFAAQRVYLVKSGMLSDIYSDIIFTRLAVETQQYTRQIEYGIQNGKNLENFYNMQSILSNVKRCSSYINGAYIVSKDCRLVYSFADEGNETPGMIKVPVDDSLFAVYEADNGSFLLSVNIDGQNDVAAGYLVLDISNNITNNAISEFNRENFIQISVIGTLALLAGAAALIHLCRRENCILSDCTRVVSISICTAMAIDGAVSLFKLQIIIDSLIQQSVSKITMTLQNDLDTVKDLVSRIYDLNSWLFESCRQVPFIDNLIYDKNYKISAVVSENFTTGQIARYGILLAEIVGICVLAGAFICMLGIFADKLINKRKNKGEQNAGSNKEQYATEA